jgi:hypothetical protein
LRQKCLRKPRKWRPPKLADLAANAADRKSISRGILGIALAALTDFGAIAIRRETCAEKTIAGLSNVLSAIASRKSAIWKVAERAQKPDARIALIFTAQRMQVLRHGKGEHMPPFSTQSRLGCCLA